MNFQFLRKKVFALFGIGSLSITLALGQVTLPHYEAFDYPVGSALQTQTGWAAANSGDDLLIASGNLSIPGLQAPTGNKLTFGGDGIDALKAITSQNSGTIYMSFILKVNDVSAATSADGGYFIGFANNNTTFGGTVWLKKDNANFTIGVAPRTTVSTIAYSPTLYQVNSEIFIVVAYKFNASSANDEAMLWINPASGSFGSGTAPAPLLSVTNTGGTDLSSIGYFFVRQKSTTETPIVEMDEIRVALSWAEVTPAGAADTQAPVVVSLLPANGATRVAVNTSLSVTFDENIAKGTGSVVIKKKSDNSPVATIDVTSNAVAVSSKTATITLPANLVQGTEYFVNIDAGAFKDLSDNSFGGITDNTTWRFTTISATDPTITLTAPNGGETFYAGEQVTFTWTSTNFETNENVRIEGYVSNSQNTDYNWIDLIASTTNDGSETYTIPASASYGTGYKIRISGVSNGASDESDAVFTVIANASNIQALRAMPVGWKAKFTGKATITYARTVTGTSNYSQKYIQDETAAILIHDGTTPPGFITDTYTVGEGITNIEGTITVYNSILELVPYKTTGQKITDNPAIVPQARTLSSLTPADQSKLMKFEGVTFTSASGNFAAATNYNISDASGTGVFRTLFGEADYIGQAIPTTSKNIIGIIGQNNTNMQITARSLNDFTEPTDTQVPTVSFNPVQGATDVLRSISPTITFSEAIRNIDDSEITNTNVASLITLKQTDANGTNVAFAATIDDTKKVITVDPTTDLAGSQVYYLAVAPVEDAAGNATTMQSVTFATISATTPTITLTSPNGDEKYYAGQQVTFTWTTTNFDAAENVKIDAYIRKSTGWEWENQIASTANDGTETFTIPAGAKYGTQYKIRLSGVSNGASDESDNPFTVVAVVSNIAGFKALSVNDVAKVNGEVIISFIRTANRNQKYVQDANAGILIDDNDGIITTSYSENDGITGLEGKLVMYGTYTYELVPTSDPGPKTSSNNTITPIVQTLAQFKANHLQYQSMLVRVEGVTIKEADGTAKFAASSSSSNYTMQQGTEESVIRQAWKTGETDLIDAVIPTGTLNIVGIVGQFTSNSTTTPQLQPRRLSDISSATGVPDPTQSELRVYPNPFSDEILVQGIGAVKRVLISNLIGQVQLHIDATSLTERINTTSLPRGVYLIVFEKKDGTKHTIKLFKQ